MNSTLVLLALVSVPAGALVERTVGVMGTELRIVVEATDRAAALAAGERAVRALEEAEGRLSTWRSTSELARFQAAPAGRPVELSPALAADLAGARACWQATGGAFDPTVGALVRAWGLRGGGRRPAAGELARALAATGMAGLLLDGREAVRRRADLVLEEGGFGKGAGLVDALAALAADPRVRRASLDLGGQLAVYDSGPRTAEWRFTLAHPRARRQPAVAVRVDGGSVATSGNGERGIEVDGERLGHLLDPRSGRPAPDFGSLTVWTEDPLRADCLSTGLYVLGPEAALAWAGEHPGVEVLILETPAGGESLRARATPGFAGRLSPLVPGLTIEFPAAESPPATAPEVDPKPEGGGPRLWRFRIHRPHEPARRQPRPALGGEYTCCPDVGTFGGRPAPWLSSSPWAGPYPWRPSPPKTR